MTSRRHVISNILSGRVDLNSDGPCKIEHPESVIQQATEKTRFRIINCPHSNPTKF